MKNKKILSVLFAALGAALAAGALTTCLGALNAEPVLLKAPEAALETAQTVMDAVCRGDYEAAGGMMYGSPDLGASREPADEVGVLLWDAFVDSISYELTGECYATDSGVAQDVRVTSLDLSSVTAVLRERAQTLLTQRVEDAEDAEQVYDENGDYREDFVMDVLYDAAVQALEEDAAYSQRDITLNLVCRQGQWWVVPDQALLSAISGGVAG